MPVVAIGTQVQVLGKNLLDRFPAVIDVARCAPRVGDIGSPQARESPAADVENYVLFAAVLDGVGNQRVLLLSVKAHVASSAPVHLDEVKVPVTEVELAVLVFMARHSHVHAVCQAVSRSAAVVTRIGVDARLEPQRVDIVHQRAHAVRETVHVQPQVAVLAASLPVAVVDVDVAVARLLQAAVVHGVGLTADKLLVDVEGKRVPRAPAHGRRALRHGREGKRQSQEYKSQFFHHFHLLVEG